MSEPVSTTRQPLADDEFLGRLEQAEIPFDELMGAVLTKAQQDPASADEWATLLRDALAERGRLVEAVRVLHAQAQWDPENPSRRVHIGRAAAALLESSPEYRRLFEHIGFDKGLPAAECIRRLLLILSLKPDAFAYDRTWGFGLVRSVDLFYGRVRVDFEKKPGHELSLAYAAESLELLAPEHILVRIHKDPGGMQKLAQGNPAEVVRLALVSFGPLTIPQLQHVLSPRLISEANWKKFWESARKDLKKDARVEIPAKRSEPLILHDKEQTRAAVWIRKVSGERNMEVILDLTEELIREHVTLDSPETQQLLADRLAFVVKGAGTRKLALTAQAVVAATLLKLEGPDLEPARWLPVLLDDNNFLVVTRGLPARWIPWFFDFLSEREPARFPELLLRQLRHLNLTALTESVERLTAAGYEQQVAGQFREAIVSQTAEVEFLYWLVRNPQRAEAWGVGTPATLMRLILLNLKQDYSGERLKVKNQLRERVEQPGFLAAALADMSPLQREETIQLVRESTAWDALDRQAVLGHIVRLYPELERAITTQTEPAVAAPARLTSHRSYRERQRQLEKLVTVDIPQNSREIAIARSYGDLSENHEYKAAKEMQGILLKRRGELETMLHEVRPTDFRNTALDRAGPGTSVVLRFDDGQVARHHILGEWDQDVERGIVSSASALAKALEGARPGSRVRIPSDQGERECTLEAVAPLPPEILEWAAAQPEEPSS